MCGIIGVFNRKNQSDFSHALSRACDSIAHRGPDGTGIFAYKNSVGLGHRRLSIIDLSDKASQPMTVACSYSHSTYTIVFNGEIYNYKDLRDELASLGHCFHSDSDTEVIVHAYEEWSDEAFLKLRGMFACVLWNEASHTMVCTRDRFGIKPLYYFLDDDRFIFSSELKALRPFGVGEDISMESVASFLQQGWIAQPQTLYRGITALEPGTVLYVSETTVSQKSFASLADAFDAPEYSELSYIDATHMVRESMRDSVAAHCVADVEVGAFLSGGIDSSSVVALMREIGKKDIATVSAVFPDTSYDESPIIQQSVREFNTRHINLPITSDDFLNHLDALIDSMDQPTVDGANTYFVSLAAKRAGLRVVLSGLGGDELFYGYPIFRHMPALHSARMLHPFLRSLPALTPAITKARMCARAYGQHKSQHGFSEACNAYRGLFSPQSVRSLIPSLSSYIKKSHPSYRLLHEQHDVLKQLSYHESTHYMREQLLRDSDVFSMTHSLELRVPFVDSRVYDVVARIPSEYKQPHGGVVKTLLVDAMRDILPPHLFSVKKQGFVLPIDQWLSGPAYALVAHELSRGDIFAKREIQQTLDAFSARKLHWSRVWALFVINRFLQK